MLGDFSSVENEDIEFCCPTCHSVKDNCTCVVPYGEHNRKKACAIPRRTHKNNTIVLDKQQLMKLTKRLGGSLEVPANVKPEIDPKT